MAIQIPIVRNPAQSQVKTPVSSTNTTDRHDIFNILLKVALNTITLTIDVIIARMPLIHDLSSGL
jgi:hypothetical protein